ncbi:RNA polymerase sigma-70 factor (ECF subfamily) [Clostridium pascui]|uniref:RNA polymerase sigma factor n=1 Tax=Clostridium pascui TaxID=46609 RepID=UPI001FAFB1DF|nr:RNA polymerase sigma factor [Clostridium pascui]MBM7872118.1 RNA polymerase sigma-70 factor (ECF subfamily) [Clostridium pascui]
MDKELLQKIREGDKEAFQQLYNKYAEYSLRTASAITRNKMNAADAVQETFIRIYKNVGSFDFDKPFEPWLYRILVNECNRILSKNSNTILVDDFIQNNLQGVIEDQRKFEEYESLYKAIESLDDNNKIPIILKYLKGFKENEIAEILGINVNTIKSRLFKGRQRLKTLIEKLERGSENYESNRR